MPEYLYRAVTKQGQVVKNKVEDASKNTLIKRSSASKLSRQKGKGQQKEYY